VSEAGHIYELLRAIDQTLDAGMLRRQQSVDFLQAFEETAD